MTELQQKLKGGLFLSSMMGVTDGAFCARTLQAGGPCAMVQTGAYLAEPTATAADIGSQGSSFLPADRGACVDFLAAEEPQKQRVTHWHDTGAKAAEGVVENGRKEGTWTYWYESGTKHKEGSFKGGKEDGLWRFWQPDGSRMMLGHYRRGEKWGVWKYWDPK